jgi:hypothetical protein
MAVPVADVPLPPLWFALALLCALSWAIVDGLCKLALREHPARAVLGARWWYALPPLLATLALAPIPRLDWEFWAVLVISAPLEVGAMFLYLRALSLAAAAGGGDHVRRRLASGVVCLREDCRKGSRQVRLAPSPAAR